jgi:hypothetical protein
MWRSSLLLMLLCLVRTTRLICNHERQIWDLRVFISVNIHVIDFLVVKTCRMIGGCKRFEEIYCLPLQGAMKQNTTVWKNRQTESYVTSIYIILLRIDSVAFGCSVFIFRTKEQKSISHRCVWEVILTSKQGFIPAKFCCTWPMLLPNDGPLLRTLYTVHAEYVKCKTCLFQRFCFYKCKSTALILVTQNMDLLYPNAYICGHFNRTPWCDDCPSQ